MICVVSPLVWVPRKTPPLFVLYTFFSFPRREEIVSRLAVPTASI